MSVDAWLAVIATAGSLVAMAAFRVAAERALTVSLCLLMLTRAIGPREALSGLSNQGVATVALLFIVASGVRRSGALGRIVSGILGRSRAALAAQVRLMIPTAGLSAFLNNTPVVAMLLPEVRRWSSENKMPGSLLLLPLSYASIVGGMCTLIGSSTNLLIDGQMVDAGYGHLDIFWIAAVGVPAAVAAIVVMTLLGRLLLPAHEDREQAFADPRTFTSEMFVEEDGPLVGKSLGEISAPGLRAFAPIEIRRTDSVIAAPRSDKRLDPGDVLVFAGPSAEILAMQRIAGLRSAADSGARKGPAGTLVEAVVGANCPLIGSKVGDGTFRRHYGAAVAAVSRHGHRVPDVSLGGWELEVGDTLLLEAQPGFVDEQRHGTELVLVSDHGRQAPPVSWHPPFALFLVAAMAAAAASGVLSMLEAAAIAALTLIVARVASWEDLTNDVDWRVLLAIVSALGLGSALHSTGAAPTAARLIAGLGGDSPLLALVFVYLATAIATEMVTNNAAAVLLLPIALNTSIELGVSWQPFVAAVMIAASASFITPIGYQTNLMVYGPGGYRFGDFLRFGAPVSLVVAAVTLGLAPMIWPF